MMASSDTVFQVQTLLDVFTFEDPIDAATYSTGASYYFGSDTPKILSLYPPTNNSDNRFQFNSVYTDLFFK